MLPIAYGCTKASFLFFYMRIFSVNHRSKTHTFLVAFVVLIFLWVVSFFFATLFQVGLSSVMAVHLTPS